MKRIAVIGGGISGLVCAQMLSDKAKVRVFERESRPGGLIRCERIAGSLFHLCGGHVFNTDPIAYSWFYQPSAAHHSHRFICTGNFAPSNNALGKMTCTVEFTDFIGEADIRRELDLMPYHPRYLTHHYSPCTYPIQHSGTRGMIKQLKNVLAGRGIYLSVAVSQSGSISTWTRQSPRRWRQ